MREQYHRQLEQLHTELLQMGALCEEVIAAAAEALRECSPEMAARVRGIEEAIDRKERDVENLCLKLLLQQQPVARDLRKISAALKLISDLERIGDQAADIAELTPFLAETRSEDMESVRDMARTACRMVTESVESFVEQDLELAHAVCTEDDEMDALFVQVKNTIVRLLQENQAQGEAVLDLLMIAKYFERIGDHATNVAEWVEYVVTGVHPQLN
ncbi:MAG: phosphate signaling complex protein PhoU [Ruminococcaceae bacterium]|nr:phosphate signaling complex protein PhoU [Oscillospiraceae bacterium]